MEVILKKDVKGTGKEGDGLGDAISSLVGGFLK